MLALTQTMLGLCAILGLIIVDAAQHRVNWSASGTGGDSAYSPFCYLAVLVWLDLLC